MNSSNSSFYKRVLERSQQYGVAPIPLDDLFTMVMAGQDTAKQRIDALLFIQRWLRNRQQDATLLSTDIEELIALGLEETFAYRIMALLELVRRLSTPAQETYLIKSPGDAARLLMPEMQYLTHEQVRVLVLDTHKQVILNTVLYHGTLNSASVRVPELFRPAITRSGDGILIAHNHPSGSPDPSPEDLSFTEQVVQAAKVLDIELVDHLIIGAGKYTSLKEELRW